MSLDTLPRRRPPELPPLLPPPPPRRASRRRLAVLVLVTLVLFGLVVGRLVLLQGVDGERWAVRAEDQRLSSVALPAERGVIFDRRGEELALSVPQSTVWADPRLVTDPSATADRLAPVLGVDRERLLDALTRPAEFVYLARQVDDATADRVRALELDGVELLAESRRFYPAGGLARPVLGDVDLDHHGIAGLERSADASLTGEPGRLLRERDPDGRSIPGGERRLEPPQRGDDLVLTLDRSLQHAAESALAAAVAEHRALGGSVVVMDVDTGDVLAMATVDTRLEAGSVPANAPLVEVFEPGSVAKIVTLAAAIEEGVATPESRLTVPPVLRIGGSQFKDDHPQPTSVWTPREILVRSSNVGTILLAQRLGPERMEDHLRRFGLGRETGLGFPGESAGVLHAAETWSGTDIGSVPIGQGISVTAMQLAGAVNTIANGGVWIAPRLVAATIGADGTRHDAPLGEQRRAVSEATAEVVASMLAEAVETDAGTGQAADVPGYQVAGKTGTARKPQPGGGYLDATGHFRYVSSFAGFLPADDPQLSVVVVLDEPDPDREGYYASTTAAPLFAEVARVAVRLLGVPPAG